MKLKTVYSYCSDISKFYENQAEPACNLGIFVYFDDDIANVLAVNNKSAFFYDGLKPYVKMIISNIKESIKSKLKKRPPNYTKFAFSAMHGGKDISINLRNGTAVVIETAVVRKFYFKDTKYFFEYYSVFEKATMTNVKNYGDFIVVESPRYDSIYGDRVGFSQELMLADFEASMRRHALIETGEIIQKLTTVYKFSQICGFYSMSFSCKQEHFVNYLNVLGYISKAIDRGGVFQSVVHGDLWLGNIMKDNGRYKFIDYDKSLVFCKNYDYIYFYLMNNKHEWKSFSSPKRFSINDYFYIFLNGYKSEGLPYASDLEIKVSYLFFFFLKVVESDLQHGPMSMGANLECVSKSLLGSIIL